MAWLKILIKSGFDYHPQATEIHNLIQALKKPRHARSYIFIIKKGTTKEQAFARGCSELKVTNKELE